MLYICDIDNGKLGIKNTDDDRIEYYSPSEMSKLLSEYKGLAIAGVGTSFRRLICWDEEIIENLYTGDYLGKPKMNSDGLTEDVFVDATEHWESCNKVPEDAQKVILRRKYYNPEQMLVFEVAYTESVNEGTQRQRRKTMWHRATDMVKLLTKYKFSNVVMDIDNKGFTYSGMDGVVHFDIEKLRLIYSREPSRYWKLRDLKLRFMGKTAEASITDYGVVTYLSFEDGVLNIPDGCKWFVLPRSSFICCNGLVIPSSFRCDYGRALDNLFMLCTENPVYIETHSRHFTDMAKIKYNVKGDVSIQIDFDKSEPVSALCLLIVLTIRLGRASYIEEEFDVLFQDDKFLRILTPDILNEMWDLLYNKTYRQFKMLSQLGGMGKRHLKYLLSIYLNLYSSSADALEAGSRLSPDSNVPSVEGDMVHEFLNLYMICKSLGAFYKRLVANYENQEGYADISSRYDILQSMAISFEFKVLGL